MYYQQSLNISEVSDLEKAVASYRNRRPGMGRSWIEGGQAVAQAAYQVLRMARTKLGAQLTEAQAEAYEVANDAVLEADGGTEGGRQGVDDDLLLLEPMLEAVRCYCNGGTAAEVRAYTQQVQERRDAAYKRYMEGRR